MAAVNLEQRTSLGVFWAAAQGWVSRLLSFATFVVLARLLEPSAFGLIALATVFILLLQLLIEEGFAEAIVQAPAPDRRQLTGLFWINLAISVLIAAALYFGSVPISAALGQADLAPVLQALTVTLPLGALVAVHQGLLRREFQFKALAARTIFATLAGAVAAIAAAFNGLGVWSLVLQQVVYRAVAAATIWWWSPWRPDSPARGAAPLELVRFGGLMMGVRSVDFLREKGYDLLVGAYLGPVTLGYYNVAFRLLQTFNQLTTQVVTHVLLSTFATLQHDIPRAREAFYAALRLSSAVTLPVFLGLYALAPDVVAIVFGAKWLPAVPAVQAFMLLGALYSLTYFHGVALTALGRPGWRLALNAATAAMALAAFFVARSGDLRAVALAYALAVAAMAPVGWWLTRRLLGLTVTRYARSVGPQLIAGAALVGVTWWVRTRAGWALPLPFIAAAAAGATTYLAALALLSPALPGELLARARRLRSKDGGSR